MNNSRLRQIIIVILVLLTFSGCSTKSTDTGVLRADLDAMKLELDKVIEENVRLQAAVEDLEIELEKQKIALEETESELAQMSISASVPTTGSLPAPTNQEELFADNAVPSNSEEEANSDTVPDDAILSAELPETVQSSPEPSQQVVQENDPAPEPEHTPQPSSPVVGDTVYITKTGKKYHTNSACNGGTYYECSLEDALAKGLTPCKRCAGG